MSDAAARNMRTAWFVVVLLCPVALLNYLDRQMLATMKSSVVADIPSIAVNGLTDQNWGFMLGSFKWIYAIFSPLGGFVADRFSRRFTICASLFVWSGVTWWTGHVGTYHELLWARALMGISEAFYIPAALALIADYHRGGTRSRAVGIHQMAIYCGVIVGSFSGYVADEPTLGWRFAFDACGVFGMLYALPLVFLLRDAPRNGANGESLVDGQSAGSFWSLFTNVSFLLLVMYFTLPALAGWIVRDWMPTILKERFMIPQGQAGVAAMLPYQCAAIFGAIVGGWMADRSMRRTIRGRIYVSAFGMCCIVPAIFGAGNAVSLSMAVGFLALFGLGWGLFDGNNMPILCQIVRPNLRATGYGIMNFLSISCGGFADWGFGILKARGTPVNLIFSMLAAAGVASIVLVLLIRPKPELSEPQVDA